MSGIPLNIVKLGADRQTDNHSFAIPLTTAGTSLITISGGVNSATANGLYSFQKVGAAQGAYQVTSGKKFLILGAAMTSSSTGYALLGTGTASVTDGTTSAPAGVVYFCGGVAAGVTFLWGQTANQAFALPQLVGMSFAALTYPFFKVGTGSQSYNLTLVGIEV
jgi:hypothetical protein